MSGASNKSETGEKIHARAYSVPSTSRLSYRGHACVLACGERFLYVTNSMVSGRDMLRLTNDGDARCKHWALVVVLLAAGALTVSVATRYGYSHAVSDYRTASVQKHSSPEPARQRLLKNAATWIPPVVCYANLQAPASYPRIAAPGPPIPSRLFEKNLYNRPPPFRNLSFS